MSKQFHDAVDFSKGMNTEFGGTANDSAPLFLQDAILGRQPEIWRRGGHFVRRWTGEDLPQIIIPENWEVLAAELHGHSAINVGIIIIMSNPALNQTVVRFYPNNSTTHIQKAISTTHAATVASISIAWSKEDKPNGIVVTSDIATWFLRIKSDGSFADDASEGYIKISDSASGGGQLSGGGWLHTATVGPYTFLANREAGPGINAGTVGAGRGTLAWCQIMRSDIWNDAERDPNASQILKNGSYQNIPTQDTINIEALAGINKDLLIFKRNQILKMTVTANPDNWEISKASGVGTLDQQSLAYHESSVIFASQTGVYMFNGYDIGAISGTIQTHYLESILGYNNDWRIVGHVHKDYYVLSIRDGDRTAGTNYCGNHIVTYVCHIPSGAWGTFSNCKFMQMATQDRGFTLSTGFCTNNSSDAGASQRGRLMAMQNMFRIPTGYKKDPALSVDGQGENSIVPHRDELNPSTPLLKIKTRFQDMGSPHTRKRLRHVLVRYAMKRTEDADHKLLVRVQRGHNGQGIAAGLLPPSEHPGEDIAAFGQYMTQVRIPVTVYDQAFSIEISELSDGASQAYYVGLTGIQLGYIPMRANRTPEHNNA